MTRRPRGHALCLALGALAAHCSNATYYTDGGAPDRPHQAALADVATMDAAVDRPDATVDLGVDASVDASADTPVDASIDVAVDHPSDAGFDVGFDAGFDAGFDVGFDVGFDTGPPLAPTEAWVPMLSRWRYLDDGVEPDADWRTASFDDGAWRTGDAQFGYGEGDEATTVSFGPNPARHFITTWFRQRFDVASRAGVRRVILRLLRDDGAVVWINGREVHRSNMPTGPISGETRALATVSGFEENSFEEVVLDPSVVREGANVIAVEVHQATYESSDLGFDLGLIGLRADAPSTPGGDPVLLAAGDISRCDSTDDDATARLLDNLGGTIAALGDNAYLSGSEEEYRRCFAPTWGRHLARMRPMPGNHEYNSHDAAPYYRYFGDAAGPALQGWYSYELGAWHVVVLNSNCAAVGGCHPDSEQERWLRADLAAHPARCTVAMWHHPRFSGGDHGDDPQTSHFWRALEAAGADLVVNGHDHDYERFAPRRSDGTRDDANGIREFVVGTGGARLIGFRTVGPESEARNSTAHGVLRLVLHPDGYDWSFVPIAGARFSDSGRGACH